MQGYPNCPAQFLKRLLVGKRKRKFKGLGIMGDLRKNIKRNRR
jgi:hypothetical protein